MVYTVNGLYNGLYNGLDGLYNGLYNGLYSQWSVQRPIVDTDDRSRGMKFWVQVGEGGRVRLPLVDELLQFTLSIKVFRAIYMQY